jgi:alpha-tubulin suppressor-like RCC1 family protein
MAAGVWHCLFVTASRRLLACGHDAAVGHGDARLYYSPIPVAAMAGVRVQSVAAGGYHSLALCLDGRVCSWGKNDHGQLGRGDVLARPVPALMEGLQGVRGIAAASGHSLAVTQQGYVFQWGESFTYGVEDSLRPTTVEGFGGVPMRRVHAGWSVFFTIGEDGEFFSCGCGKPGLLGHGDEQSQPSPKRVEALRGVRVSSAAVGDWHALALTEDGLVYAWGENHDGAVLSNPHVERELLPKPVEALRGVRVANVAAACDQSFAVADTGELWAWGNCNPLLGHGKGARQPLPKLIKSLRGIKVDAVLAGGTHTHVRADSGRVYSWGDGHATRMGVIGLGPSVIHVGRSVLTPQRIPGLRLACGLGV